MSSNNVTFFCLFMLTCFFDPCILLISFQRHLYQSVMPLSLSLSLSLSLNPLRQLLASSLPSSDTNPNLKRCR